MRIAMFTTRWAWIVLAATLVAGSNSSRAAEPSAFPPEGVEFFEKNVRPILAESCLRCHGEKKQSSGLRLDSRAAVLEGGENGPAIVPGEPDKSLLVQAVRYAHEDIKMPPKARLPETSVEAIAAWVKLGAPWPAQAPASAETVDQAAQTHWAFRPVRRVAPPSVKDSGRVGSPIDAFILARLEAQEMTLSPQADRRTLIRRASFDLTGLPPTAEEIARFEADPAPDAFARVVDRLLASPHYGERWGRHWLDVARYADTKGYVFQEERRYPYAYTYRDYIVRAFNQDRPYDQLIREQLAADLLPEQEKAKDPAALAALGYLTVGRRFLNNQQDILDDRIDVVTRGLLGLTVACARCHDHKFDPIPTDDYYSLYGVFASSVEPAELPLLPESSPSPESRDFARQLADRQKMVDGFLDAKRDEIRTDLRQHMSVYFLAAFELGFDSRAAKLDERATADGLKPGRLRWQAERWKVVLNAPGPVFAPWKALAASPAGEFASKVPDVLKALGEAKPPIHPLVARALADSPPASLHDLADRYADLFEEAESKEKADAGPDWESLRQAIRVAGGPLDVTFEPRSRILDRAEQNKLRTLRKKVDELQATHPGAPPRAMVVNDATEPTDPHVFIRGNPGRPGKAVPRQFLKVLSGPDRKPFQNGSGRLELAEAIARADNPLTARVMVNRIWQQHFGQGLVATPSDFGLRSDPPTHPELLDYLADAFVQSGWSIKAMHRLIILSSTYQQQSENLPAYAERDPQNRLFWKFNRRRLDFESMRDTLLAVSGRLDETVGGRPGMLGDSPFPTRRTLYGFIDRQNLDGIYRTFDFASPDASSPRRYVTTVPQQALYLMNSPFVIEQARHLAGSLETSASSADPEARVRLLYQRVFGRSPEPREVALGVAFVARQAGANPPPPVWQFGSGAFDESTQRVRDFRPLPHWTGTAWQTGPKLPDPEGSYLHLTAKGGHVGPDAQRAAIRRWTAPRDLVIAIEGTLGHESEKGDGVRARVVASRTGELGSWIAHHARVPTPIERYEVKKGETIDLVVDCRSQHDFDTFDWSPTVRVTEASPAPSWSAQADFHGPLPRPLAPWEEYAQVLLLTNEFMFVD
jgi:hypothetical protein